MTLGSYIQVIDNYTLSDNAIERVIVKCNKTYGFSNAVDSDVSTIDEMELDLNEAWAWISATGIVNGGGEKKQIGNRSLTRSSISYSAVDKKQWIENANRIFKKYSLPIISDATVNRVFDASFTWGGRSHV